MFDPFQVRGVTLRNRVVMAPMCQYSTGGDGKATDWHFVHYGARAVGGVGLIVVEATAVEPRGRIDLGDLGLWDDAQIAPLARVAQLCAEHGATPGIQLAHAGRKAGSDFKGHWEDEPVAPSALAFDDGWRLPHELSTAEISEVVGFFAAAARRAVAAGFQLIEVHGAHGYLISSFLSPIANHRDDAYGGDLRARARFGREVLAAVRAEIPDDVPLMVRISGTDWVPEGNSVDDMATAARLFHEAGADLIDVSSGGNTPQVPTTHPGYMVPLSEAIRRQAGVPTVTAGLISDPRMAEEIVRNGRADLVALGRELLRRPYWPLWAAHELGVDVPWSEQYETAKL